MGLAEHPMTTPISTRREALALFREHDTMGLYDTLEAWQQRELLCIIRRVWNAACAPVKLPVEPVDSTEGRPDGAE